MGLRLYNTLTRKKEDFVPLDPSNVRLYVCGPTVYDFAHIGNARPVIVFDVLYRLLRHLYGESHVTYVRNITDVDDKIIDRARRDHPDLPLNAAIAEVTSRTEKQFHDDVAALGCLPPTVEPRATAHIGQMIAMIERLIANGKAYPADGHVLFAVARFQDYGRLARRSTDEMVAGARVEVAPYKKDPMDFVLWKPSAADEPGWDSPWGRGRPGWHIECSAMSATHLGETFDIHGGGIDLVFPHHENEIAQSRCAHGSPVMANYWMHNGFLQVEGRKMAKSEGNFVTIRELLGSRKFGGNMWHGSVLRLAMLTTHYRQPIDWTVDRLVEMRAAIKDWIDSAIGADEPERGPNAAVIKALSDDLNTPKVVTILHGLCKRSRALDADAARDLNASLRFLGLWKGESSLEICSYGYEVRSGPADIDVQPRIDARNAARAERNFTEADRIRDELAAMGVVLKDGKDPETGAPVTTWEVAR